MHFFVPELYAETYVKHFCLLHMSACLTFAMNFTTQKCTNEILHVKKNEQMNFFHIRKKDIPEKKATL